MNVPGLPHDHAASWIIFKDPLALPPEAPNLIQQHYHLALLYYLMTQNVKKDWNSRNCPTLNVEGLQIGKAMSESSSPSYASFACS